MSMKIEILEVDDDAIWMQFVHEGKPIWKQPLAQAIRDYLKPEYEIDKARGDKCNTEQAFKKVRFLESFESELKRA